MSHKLPTKTKHATEGRGGRKHGSFVVWNECAEERGHSITKAKDQRLTKEVALCKVFWFSVCFCAFVEVDNATEQT